MINNKIFNAIKKYHNKPSLVIKFLVCAYIEYNDIYVSNNKLILKYMNIKSYKKAYYNLFNEIKNSTSDFTLEDLILFFEILTPQKDTSTHGVVYTPYKIRTYIIEEAIRKLGNNYIDKLKIADISCGSGAFLLNVLHHINKASSKSFYKIFEDNIFGLDLTSYSIERTKIVLSLLALKNGEDKKEFNFNLFSGNALNFDWFSKCPAIQTSKGFDIIVGNPPYVRAKNLSNETKKLMKKWEVTKAGNPDLYIPFFEIGLKYLKQSGILGYITVNTFKRSVNARRLRAFFKENKYYLEILDFGDKQVFRNKSTYTCIVFVKKQQSNTIRYSKLSPKDLIKNDLGSYTIKYSSLNCQKGWLLNSPKVLRNISKLETTGTPLGEKYKIKNGLATLCNDIFIFKPVDDDGRAFFLKRNNKVYKIEKSICRDIVKPNKLKSEIELPGLIEKIIFPYHLTKNQLKCSNKQSKPLRLFEEDYFKEEFPNAYKYLREYKESLLKRDKGKGKLKYKWYEFGRTQALTGYGRKLLFPYMSNKPYFVFTEQKDLLLYAGYAIFSENVEELLSLKKILQSDIFWYYIRKTSKPYSNNYFALAKNYIIDFAICNLTEKEKKYLIQTDDINLINRFLIEKYKLEISSKDLNHTT